MEFTGLSVELAEDNKGTVEREYVFDVAPANVTAVDNLKGRTHIRLVSGETVLIKEAFTDVHVINLRKLINEK